MMSSQQTKKALLCLFAGAAVFQLFQISDPGSVSRNLSESGNEARMLKEDLPLCRLEDPASGHDLSGALWIDPEDEKEVDLFAKYPTIIQHPNTGELFKRMQNTIEKDPPEKWRKERGLRMMLVPSDECRLRDWNPMKFKKCLEHRRLIFFGDSLSGQMNDSLLKMLDLSKFTKRHGFNRPPNRDLTEEEQADRLHYLCRQCDDIQRDGVDIKFRAIFPDEYDGHMVYTNEIWEMAVTSIGGWQDGDILIVNYGAHYGGDWLRMREELRPLFEDKLAELPEGVTVFWRDYAPAHFNANIDGEFPDKRTVTVPGEEACSEHMTAPSTPSMERKMIDNIIDKCGEKCQRIRRLGVWDLLRNAWDQHDQSSTCVDATNCDCRHFTVPGPMEFANIMFFHQFCEV